MITTIFNETLSEKESHLISLIINKNHSYILKLSEIYITPQIKAMKISMSKNYGLNGIYTYTDLFKTAIVESILIAKRYFEQYIPSNCHTYNAIMKNILHSYFKKSYLNNEILNEMVADLKEYSKYQPRIFYQHTKKNYFNWSKDVESTLTSYNNGHILSHEYYIIEIEYLLKNQIYIIKTSDKLQELSKLQTAVDNYAIHQIQNIFSYENITIKELKDLRKTYSKFRLFFLEGKKFKKAISKSYYDKYFKVFKLIYQYVKKYTPSDLLDLAYMELDSRYSLYSYCSFITGDKNFLLKNLTIPEIHSSLFNDFMYAASTAIAKIYFYQKNYYPHFHSITDFFSFLDTCQQSLLPFSCSKLIKNSFSVIDEISDNIFNLDEHILYNSLWNNKIMLSQKEFISQIENISYNLGFQNFTFKYNYFLFLMELFGINIKTNYEYIKDIFKMLQETFLDSAIIRTKTITDDDFKIFLYKRILDYCLSDQFLNIISINLLETDSNFNYLPFINQSPKKILSKIKDKLERDIAKYDESTVIPQNTNAFCNFYQFIYRNYLGLGKPDILKYNIYKNRLLFITQLSHYNIKMTKTISINEYPWLRTSYQKLCKEYPLKAMHFNHLQSTYYK